MIERRKSFLDLWTDGRHGPDQCETQVPDDGASQKASTVIVAVDIWRHVDCDVGGPRHFTEDPVEAQPDLHEVEAEDEREGNQLGEIEAVPSHLVKLPAAVYTQQHYSCLGRAAVRRRTRDRKVTGSTPAARVLSSQLGQLSLPSLRGR